MYYIALRTHYLRNVFEDFIYYSKMNMHFHEILPNITAKWEVCSKPTVFRVAFRQILELHS